MTDRLRMAFDEPLPPSTPLRYLQHDECFDVVEAFEVVRAPAAGLQKPRLISSAHGPIRHLLLTYPPGARRLTYEDLLSKLPSGTRITLVAHPEFGCRGGGDRRSTCARRRGDSHDAFVRGLFGLGRGRLRGGG